MKVRFDIYGYAYAEISGENITQKELKKLEKKLYVPGRKSKTELVEVTSGTGKIFFITIFVKGVDNEISERT